MSNRTDRQEAMQLAIQSKGSRYLTPSTLITSADQIANFITDGTVPEPPAIGPTTLPTEEEWQHYISQLEAEARAKSFRESVKETPDGH